MRAWREEDRGNRWYGESPGDCYHIGLMGRNGKVLNAQGVKTGFVASDAKGWAFAAPLNAVKYKAEGGGKMFGNATVSVTSGYLNIREGAGTRSKIIAKAENGTRVNVIREAGGTGWVFGKLENGVAGYMAGAYLVEDENTPDADAGNAADAGGTETTTFRRSDGVYVTLAGKWTIAED
ncbi:SH3 domain-containing protein [Alistipes putredinis]|uniref:SH3 domain-containing protein n=1 Tax=Alistipes putredinis TaxID=28117 RepID=UPI003AEF1727